MGSISTYRDQYSKLKSQLQDEYTKRKGALDDYEKTQNETLHSLLKDTSSTSADMFAKAKGMSDVYSENYLPANLDYLKSAQNYDTPERRAQEAGKAMSDVSVAGDAARKGALDRLEAYGIDPSMTRGQAIDANARLDTGLAAVKAGSDARTGVEERGRAYLSDALDKGNQIQQNANQTSATASAIGKTGVDAANQTSTTATENRKSLNENLTQQQNLTTAEANDKYNEMARREASGGSPWGAIGSTVGTLGGAAIGASLGPAGSVEGAALGAQIGGQTGSATGGMFT